MPINHINHFNQINLRSMVLFPNCKINLGLNIISKREDGFHNLETVFMPVRLQDALEIVQKENNEVAVNFATSGIQIPGMPADNLCVKAYWLLKKTYPQLPAIKMHLLKAIPMGAGLGGGSANGAFTLIMLNKKFGLGITEQGLIDYALQLGSDCPFFIVNKPCFAQQRGEKLEEINLSLSGYKLLLVNAGVHISTGWAFSQIKPARPAKSIKEIIRQPLATWKGELINDFEQPVISHYTVLQHIRAQLYGSGAVYAAMTGSGSTFFGIFEKSQPLDATVFPASYLVKEVIL